MRPFWNTPSSQPGVSGVYRANTASIRRVIESGKARCALAGAVATRLTTTNDAILRMLICLSEDSCAVSFVLPIPLLAFCDPLDRLRYAPAARVVRLGARDPFDVLALGAWAEILERARGLLVFRERRREAG